MASSDYVSIKDKLVAVFGKVKALIGECARKDEIAAKFSDATPYSVGDMVVYDGNLYRCTQAHTGEWNAADFVKTTVDEAITRDGTAEIGDTIDIGGKTLLASDKKVDVASNIEFYNAAGSLTITHAAGSNVSVVVGDARLTIDSSTISNLNGLMEDYKGAIAELEAL